MTYENVRLAQLKKLVPQVCQKDTASGDGAGWTSENPTFGHCAVVALCVQGELGGELLRISLQGTPYAPSGSHYFNRLPDGSVIDLTKSQFGDWNYTDITVESRTREAILKHPDTQRRYYLFSKRLSDAVHCD